MTVAVTPVTFDGKPLSFATMARIGAGLAVPLADPAAMERVRASRAVMEERIAHGAPVYGATTGVGAMKDIEWSPEDLDTYNMGLVRAHHFGTGAPFPSAVVRNAMAIRVNTALTGRVGCSPELVDTYLRLLSADVVPVVRRTGSIGCADIGLMGQIGAVLTGVGEAIYHGRRLSAEAALAEAGLKPVQLAPRDSLASISINAVGYAAAAGAMRAAASAVRVMLATALMTGGGLGASRDPWKAVAHVGTEREALIGTWMMDAVADWEWPVTTHVQDPLSLRMIPQVFGTAFESLLVSGRTILAATGRTDDNPVVVEGEVLTSGGSLPLDVTVFLQTAQLALAHAARNSFNRCVLLGNGVRRDLPINLVAPGAIATGFGPIIKLAGELFARVHSMSTPISAQAMVVAAGIEDEAAFLPLVVERFERQVRALRRMAALEALLSAQAMDILGDRPAGVPGMIYEIVRGHAEFYRLDRPLSAEVEAIESDLGSDETMGKLISQAPLPQLDDFFALGPIA
ncbi:histidine ammonia-lyase [Devosia sp. 17-2-E-8]|uniref:Aromatic amino acid lyase n=3 Tax=Paradevosia shaoguanensis TaxID=1335043 RepID=A0AA41U9J4_9HYPH|nr:aromatic amino acid lyase [Paradevosia shaoguanensis]KFL25022.1 histidine ammonia-lyase [Devosia sp. 17-2-E-8]QMV03734.1 histidine ammonia-lyase [Devosia sp. D6-9]CDP53291.1 Aromatic amino acid ammonia-lyase family [Devosia sp. DBB001]MCF1740824.1 aromatic amino acid lyase [Paradevosia shaoguanensis]MCI0125308.1 aromatic amino acid lyase [Paradevosia shaoguanensis]